MQQRKPNIPLFVMPGLDPGIHPKGIAGLRVDCRVKPGNDKGSERMRHCTTVRPCGSHVETRQISELPRVIRQ
jgi:hypothetical protein